MKNIECSTALKEITKEITYPLHEQIIDIYECKHSGTMKAKIKFGNGRIINKGILAIVNNMKLLEEFDKKTIRTLSYLAGLERSRPDYSIVSQQLGNEIEDHILGIRSRNGKKIAKSVDEVSRNKMLLSKFSPIDANRIGYLVGVKETVREFNLLPKFNQILIENMPYNVYWVDKDCKMINCNQNVLDMLSMTREEFIGKTYEELSALCNWPQGLYQKLKNDDISVMQSGLPIYGEEDPPIPHNGTFSNFLTSRVPLRNKQGEVEGIAGISVEITAIKKARALAESFEKAEL